jgi:phage tail sheath protein FI
MPVQVTFPGVYVQEIPSGVQTITGVATSIGMFLGMTQSGRLGIPTRVLSFADYTRAFGSDTTVSEMTDQVRQFFINGGQQAFIMRLADGAVSASIVLKDETTSKEVLKISAKNAGAVGNMICLDVDYDTPSPESSFNMRIFNFVPDGKGGFNEQDAEIFQNLNMNPDSPLFAVNVLTQQSALVNAAPGDDITNNNAPPLFKGYALSARLFDSATSAADIRTAIKDAIHATAPGGLGKTGGFRISVDGSPFQDVVLKDDDVTNAPDIFVFLTKAIKDVLQAVSASVTVAHPAGPATPSQDYLQVQSAKDGGSVVFRSAPTADIAAALGLGIDRGGIEVDGYAKRRPAPTGLFFRLGDPDPAATPPLAALQALADADQGDIKQYTLTDSAGLPPFLGVNLGSGGKMYAKASERSMVHVRERLQTFAAKINADAAANPAFVWSADVHGYRLVLTPNSGVANTAATKFETGTGFDLHAHGMDKPNVRYYSLGASGASPYQTTPGTDGFDGTIPTTAEYYDAFDVIDRQVDLFNLMILPRATGQGDAAREAVWGPASTFCLNRRAFLIMDPRSSWSTVNQIDSEIDDLRIGLVSDHAAIYWPRLLVGTNGTTKGIDPAGSIAGLMARIDSNRGVWKAPAGIEASIRGIRGVQDVMSDPENGVINPKAVNAIRVFPTGIVSWGARTMDGFENSGNSDYRYIPVRRVALFIEESLYRGLKFAVFEPNDEPLWGQIRVAAGAFMNNLFRQGAFQGQKASDAYFVKVDSETTTPNDINLGIVNVLVGFAPLKPAEFVIITLQQMAGQVQT